MAYNYKNIRTLLTNAFTEDELRGLINYTDNLRPLRNSISSSDSPARIVDKLIDFCDRKLILDPLLGLVAQEAPARYQKHRPYKSDPGADPALPAMAELSAVGISDVRALSQNFDKVIIYITQGDLHMTTFNQQGQTVHGNQQNIGGDQHIGDNITIGDVTNSNLNLKSTLTNVTQNIGNIPNASDEDKKTLQALMTQLTEALANVPAEPAENVDSVEAVTQTAESLTEMAAQPKPNPVMLKVTGEGLIQAAKNLATVTPAVLDISQQVVDFITQIK